MLLHCGAIAAMKMAIKNAEVSASPACALLNALDGRGLRRQNALSHGDA
jgi:hypothetical protein